MVALAGWNRSCYIPHCGADLASEPFVSSASGPAAKKGRHTRFEAHPRCRVAVPESGCIHRWLSLPYLSEVRATLFFLGDSCLSRCGRSGDSVDPKSYRIRVDSALDPTLLLVRGIGYCVVHELGRHASRIGGLFACVGPLGQKFIELFQWSGERRAHLNREERLVASENWLFKKKVCQLSWAFGRSVFVTGRFSAKLSVRVLEVQQARWSPYMRCRITLCFNEAKDHTSSSLHPIA